MAGLIETTIGPERTGNLITYTCINCGASLSGPGECQFCHTTYNKQESFQRTQLPDSTVWIRVKPNFPDRGVGGSERDPEKEDAIERSVLTRLKGFLDAQKKKGGTAQHAVLFVQTLIKTAANYKRGSVNQRLSPTEDPIQFLSRERSIVTDNQANILRILPELLADNEFWSAFFFQAALGGKLEQVHVLSPFRPELEKSFGFLIPLESTQAAPEQQPDFSGSDTEGNNAWGRLLKLLRRK